MLKGNIGHAKTIQNPYFVFRYVSSLIPWFVLSLIPWFNSLTMFDQKSWTQDPDFSCQALAESLKKNSTLMNLNLDSNGIGDEGAKAWWLDVVGEDGVKDGKVGRIIW